MELIDDQIYTPAEVAACLKVNTASVRQSIPGRKNKRPKLGRWLPNPGLLGTRARWTGKQIREFLWANDSANAVVLEPKTTDIQKRKPGRPRKLGAADA